MAKYVRGLGKRISMSDEEWLEYLKKEADKLGYKLYKKPEPKVRLIPCVCGSNRRQTYFTKIDGQSLWFLECSKCHRRGYYGKNDKEKRIGWNHAIEEMTKE